MSYGIAFIETPLFTKQIKELATDGELKSLQVALIARPDKGGLIQGTGGLRKIRMVVGNYGKSGIKDINQVTKKRGVSMSIFNELKTSLEQAVDIKNGHQQEARVTKFEVADVKAIRSKLSVSQREFSNALGTSVDTIKSWENKRRNPTGLAAKVLATIQDDPKYFHEIATH